VAVAADVADALHLDRVLWIPAGEPPHKRDLAVTPAPVRLAMVRTACSADRRFEACAAEIDRPGPSYMVDTVAELSGRFPDADLFLILGADQFRSFGAWRRPDEIVRRARLAVMDRAGESAAASREEVPGGRDAVHVPVRRVDVSSTDIRTRRQRGEDVSAWVPAGVSGIIERERLYSAP
jgi:nicotinate-nucleotide adenylyltransferase